MLSCARYWGTPVGTESGDAQVLDVAILEVAILELAILEVATLGVTLLEALVVDTVDGLVEGLESLMAVAVDAPVVELSGGPAICVH